MAHHSVGTHRTTGPNIGRGLFRALRRSRSIAQRALAAGMYDEFGQRLHLLAAVLTDDPELAEQLVVQTIAAHESEPSTLQELSAGIYIAWLAWGRPALSNLAPPPGASATALMIDEIHDLDDDQRAALGLCKYGGHTYQRAAAILDLAPERVATLLGDALRSLGTPRAARQLTVVGA